MYCYMCWLYFIYVFIFKISVGTKYICVCVENKKKCLVQHRLFTRVSWIFLFFFYIIYLNKDGDWQVFLSTKDSVYKISFRISNGAVELTRTQLSWVTSDRAIPYFFLTYKSFDNYNIFYILFSKMKFKHLF